MLKSGKHLARGNLNPFVGSRNMGFLNNISGMMNKMEQESVAFRVPTYDPTIPLEGLEPIKVVDKDREYNITKLSNGFTVLTESPAIPTHIHMGICMDVGSRDEAVETSGACQAIKNTYLKTLRHTNETINYGMIQMSGGNMEMEYDQEKMYFKAHCLEHDVYDLFQLLIDAALEPKSHIAANIARVKNEKMHKLNRELEASNPFGNFQQDLLTTAFGYNTLGMPLIGLESNVTNINFNTLSKFMNENVSPERIIISGSGVRNHQEFVSLVKDKVMDIMPQPEFLFKRSKSVYQGGEIRDWREQDSTSITVGLESVGWRNPDMPAFTVMQTLIGSATPFSTGGPGKGMHSRAVRHIFQKYGFVESIDTLNQCFSDAGIFAINIVGASPHSLELLDAILRQFHALAEPIPYEELNRAKNILKINVLLAMERQCDRLEEITKNYQTFGEMTFMNYCDIIDSVTSDQINQAVQKMFKTRPTVVIKGSAINQLPGLTEIESKFS